MSRRWLSHSLTALVALTGCGGAQSSAASRPAPGPSSRETRVEVAPQSASPADDAPAAPPEEKTQGPGDRQDEMARLCEEMASAITQHAGRCPAMGHALSELFEPHIDLIHDYQASAVSKAPDRPFAAAEVRCNTTLTETTLETFWACKDDPGVQSAFRHMNALKP